MSPAKQDLYTHALPKVGRTYPILLFVLVTLGIALGPSIASAQQLSLSWIDNSGGQAGFIIQRATSTTGPYTQIAQVSLGVTSYSDTAALTFGTTYCYQVAAVNTYGISVFSNLACGSPSGGFTLAAAKAGTGAGTVSSSPTGIDCGTACSYTYSAGTVVTLAATPSAGSAFIGWSSGGCSGTAPCGLAGNGPITVTATFDTLPTDTLTVSTKGPGTVSSSPGGISCGSVCSAAYTDGAVVTLTAAPGKGARFSGWSGGGCSGTGACMVTLSTATIVSATFSKGGKK